MSPEVISYLVSVLAGILLHRYVINTPAPTTPAVPGTPAPLAIPGRPFLSMIEQILEQVATAAVHQAVINPGTLGAPPVVAVPVKVPVTP